MPKTIATELIRSYLLAGEEVWNDPLVKTFLERRRMDERESKGDAVYGITGMPKGERCELCTHFFSAVNTNIGVCERVTGPILDVAWCMNFKLRRPRTDWQEVV